MAKNPKNLTAKELLEAIDVYGLIGIDILKCEMPHIENRGLGRRDIVVTSSSSGYIIYSMLNPALERLANAAVLELKAPFYNSEIVAHEASVVGAIVCLIANIPHAPDKEAISALKAKAPNFMDIPEAAEKTAKGIREALTSKARVLDTEYSRSQPRAY